MEALKEFSWERYIREKSESFSEKYPRRFAFAGEDNVHAFIRHAIQKAKQYNMLAEREIEGISILMFYLGHDFDLDPIFPWAKFTKFPDKNPMAREKEPESFIHLEKVYETFLVFFQETYGSDGEHYRACCSRAAQMDYRELTAMRHDDAVLDFLQRLYPQRYAKMDEKTLRGPLLQTAQVKAMDYGLDPRTGKSLFAVLMFCCGIGVDSDPLYSPLMAQLVAQPAPGIRREESFCKYLKELLAGLQDKGGES
jgi:hypothetical protein